MPVEHGPALPLRQVKHFRANEGRVIIAITSDYCWGSGGTGFAAIKKARSMGACAGARVYLYDCPARTTITEMGAFSYRPPAGKTWGDVDKGAYCKAHPLGNAIL